MWGKTKDAIRFTKKPRTVVQIVSKVTVGDAAMSVTVAAPPVTTNLTAAKRHPLVDQPILAARERDLTLLLK